MSAAIIFDQSKLKAYDGLIRLCEYAGQPEEWGQQTVERTADGRAAV